MACWRRERALRRARPPQADPPVAVVRSGPVVDSIPYVWMIKFTAGVRCASGKHYVPTGKKICDECEEHPLIAAVKAACAVKGIRRAFLSSDE